MSYEPKSTVSYGPFAETTPSGQTGWIDERRRPIQEHLRLLLSQLDGTTKYTYSIWRGTHPESIVVTSKDTPESFIQAAGSAEKMTIEVRRVDSTGNGHLYTLGKKFDTNTPPISVAIGPNHTTEVFEHELFTVDEAVDVFNRFYETENVDAGFTLRELL